MKLLSVFALLLSGLGILDGSSWMFGVARVGNWVLNSKASL